MRTSPVIVLLLLVLSLTPAAQSPRAIFEVNTIKDKVDINPGDGICEASNGKCSLRAAIMETNALGGVNTIELRAGIYTLTLDAADATGGDLDITTPVTLTGEGTDVTIIDASTLPTADRVIEVQNLTAGPTILTDLAITGGSTDQNGGGVLFASQGELTNVKLSANEAGQGGAVACIACFSLLIQDSIITGNSGTTYAGGVYVENSDLDIIGTSLNANTGGTAGALAVFGSNVYMAEVSVTDNTADFDAGGAFIATSQFANEDTLWVGNSAGGTGGAILLEGSQFAFQASLVSYNSAGLSGGGLYTRSSQGAILKASLIHNTATYGGGFVNDNSALLVTNATISGNSATIGGGVLFLHSPATDFDTLFSNVTITQNVIEPANAAEAGGVDASQIANGTITLNNTIVTGNGSKQCDGTLSSTDGNIFANTTDCTISTQSGDQTSVTDAMLSSLMIDSKSGYAAVHVPLTGSPALDNGANANCRDEDQRNLSRAHDAGDPCDVGAVEGPALSLLVNGSLEDGDANKDPDGWVLNTLSNDKLKCVNPDAQPAVVGLCALKFKDATGTISQKVTLAAPFDGVFVFGGIVDSSTAVTNAIQVKLYDSADAVLLKAKLHIEADTHGYAVVSLATPLATGVASVKMIVRYPNEGGKLFVDGLWLIPDANPLRGRTPLPLPPLPLGFRGSN